MIKKKVMVILITLVICGIFTTTNCYATGGIPFEDMYLKYQVTEDDNLWIKYCNFTYVTDYETKIYIKYMHLGTVTNEDMYLVDTKSRKIKDATHSKYYVGQYPRFLYHVPLTIGSKFGYIDINTGETVTKGRVVGEEKILIMGNICDSWVIELNDGTKDFVEKTSGVTVKIVETNGEGDVLIDTNIPDFPPKPSLIPIGKLINVLGVILIISLVIFFIFLSKIK